MTWGPSARTESTRRPPWSAGSVRASQWDSSSSSTSTPSRRGGTAGSKSERLKPGLARPENLGRSSRFPISRSMSSDVAATFTDFRGLFMVHCHMLDHEDHGMMAQFEVVPRG